MNKSEKGFTLLELLVATAIFGGVLVLIWNIFFTTYHNYGKLRQHKDILEEVSTITKIVEDEIQRAEKVEVVYLKDDGKPEVTVGILTKEGFPDNERKKFIALKLYANKTDEVPSCVIKWHGEKIKEDHTIEVIPVNKDESIHELWYGKSADEKLTDFKGTQISNTIKKINVRRNKDSDIVEWQIVMPNISEQKKDEGTKQDLETISSNKIYNFSTSLQYKE